MPDPEVESEVEIPISGISEPQKDGLIVFKQLSGSYLRKIPNFDLRSRKWDSQRPKNRLRRVASFEEHPASPAVEGPLDSVTPITLRMVSTQEDREKLLQLILSNDRFLIFRWVKVPHLASHALSLATHRIADDWVHLHGYRPSLIETFVDPIRFSGTCYQAANWQCLGQTQGRGRDDPQGVCS